MDTNRQLRIKDLLEVVSDVFDVPFDDVSVDSSMDTIEKWDSLNHMILVVALEQECQKRDYDISFTPEDIIEMVNIRIIREILKEKGVYIKDEG